MPYVDRADLPGLELIASSGAEGRIYLVDGTVPGCPTDLVFKEYKDAVKPVSKPGMGAVVRSRANLPRKQRALFDRYFAWPLRVVVSGESVDGVLLPLVPDRFFHSYVSLVGDRRIARDIDHLFRSGESAQAIDLEFASKGKRLALIHEFAKGLALLHFENIVYGDVNFKNAMYVLRPHPAVSFVDCDGVRLQGNQSPITTGQRRVPEFDPPEGFQVQNKATDLYKLAVFVRMILSPGLKGDASEAAALRVLDARGRDLLRRGLSADPGARPTAKDWVGYVKGLWTPPPQPTP